MKCAYTFDEYIGNCVPIGRGNSVSVWNIILALLVFGLIILVHELGHFLTAKAFGVKVEEFAIGMGPTLLQYEGAETTYSLRMIPMGGFVQMVGEEEASEDPRSFSKQAAWKRIIIISAGAIMNLLLGLVVAALIVSLRGFTGTTQVARFEENAVSSQVLQLGDEILSINGSRIHVDNDIVYTLIRDKDGLVDMIIRRNGEKMAVSVPFATETYPDGTTSIALDFKVLGEKLTIPGVLKYSVGWTISIAKQVWIALSDLLAGRQGISELSGPVGTTQVIVQATAQGIGSLLMIVGFITVNLGVFNLLPIPALDGGRLLFLLVEMIRRKPVPAKYEGYVHAAGFALLMALMLMVTYQDIMRLIAG